MGNGGRRLSFCYEAGPCGYGLHRLLTDAGMIASSCTLADPDQRGKSDQDRSP
jgi:hypothetical protein